MHCSSAHWDGFDFLRCQIVGGRMLFLRFTAASFHPMVGWERTGDLEKLSLVLRNRSKDIAT